VVNKSKSSERRGMGNKGKKKRRKREGKKKQD
jgi:hypothetical protein